jgi:phage portal protein BeeE
VSIFDKLFGSSGGLAPAIYSIDGRSVDAANADMFKIPTIVACRQVIADTVSSFDLIEVDRNGEPTGQRNLVLEQPDPVEKRPDTIERLVNDMTRFGTSWIRVTSFDGNGDPLSAERISPRRVVWTLTASGERIASITVDGLPVPLDSMRQSPMILDDGPIGKAPIVEVEASVRQLTAAMAFAGSYYASAAPPYAILSQTRLPPAHAEALMASWLEARDHARPALLSGDLSLETFQGQSAADALLLDAIASFDAMIARVFQVPPSIVNTLAQSNLTYSTTRQEFARWGISLGTGYLHRLEVVFSSLLPPGRFAKFDTSTLTRLDESEVLTNTVTAYEAGLISLDEARQNIGRESNGTIPQISA